MLQLQIGEYAVVEVGHGDELRDLGLELAHHFRFVDVHANDLNHRLVLVLTPHSDLNR